MSAAAELPQPAWRIGVAGLPLWVYPLHLMDTGEAVFVADVRGLASAAERAVRAYRAFLAKRGHKPVFQLSWTFVDGISGLVIRRLW